MAETSIRLLQYAVASSGMLRIDGIAAGVGVILYNSLHKTGAGLHVLAPRSGLVKPENPIMYADTAIPYVLEQLARKGVKPPYSVAIAGGSSMLGKEDGVKAGTKVVDAIRAALSSAKLTIKLDQTGGSKIRSMILDIDAGKIKIG